MFTLQTAEQTREMAATTLDSLHDQGHRLDRVEGDLYEVRSCHHIHTTSAARLHGYILGLAD